MNNSTLFPVRSLTVSKGYIIACVSKKTADYWRKTADNCDSPVFDIRLSNGQIGSLIINQITDVQPRQWTNGCFVKFKGALLTGGL